MQIRELLKYTRSDTGYNPNISGGKENVLFFPSTTNLLITNTNDLWGRILNIQKNRIVATFKQNYVWAQDISPQNSLMAFGNAYGNFELRDITTMKSVCYKEQYHSRHKISQIKFISNNTIISSCQDHNDLIKIFDIRQQRTVDYIKINLDVHQLSYSQDNILGIACGKQVQLWDVRNTKDMLTLLQKDKYKITHCQFHPQQQNILLTASSKGNFWEFDTQTCEKENIFKSICFREVLCTKFIPKTTKIIFSDDRYGLSLINQQNINMIQHKQGLRYDMQSNMQSDMRSKIFNVEDITTLLQNAQYIQKFIGIQWQVKVNQMISSIDFDTSRRYMAIGYSVGATTSVFSIKVE